MKALKSAADIWENQVVIEREKSRQKDVLVESLRRERLAEREVYAQRIARLSRIRND